MLTCIISSYISNIYFIDILLQDIDAIFGVLREALKDKPMETFQIFKEMIEVQFKNTKLQVVIHDVKVVPNYTSFLEPCLDPKFERLHKTEFTQLQWRFEAVKCCDIFPLGN